MYLEHFGLSEAPFRITPHTEFFFAGGNRGATLEALVYAIINDEGIVKVSGEVGSGKTMLCRMLMEKLPPHVVTVYLANPSLSRDDILLAIAYDLGLTIPDNTRASIIVRALFAKLIELHGQGRQVVVLIDEAHAMPTETLEEVRLLSNLETNQHKLLQLVMFGQPELDGILARADMRQLKERVTQNFSLEPLRRDDIAEYLDFRMRMAGYRGPEVFSAPAVKLITGASQGLTRRVNILAEKSLLSAFAAGSHQITPAEVGAAIRDTRYDEPSNQMLRRALVFAAGVAVVLLIIALVVAALPEAHAPRTGSSAGLASAPNPDGVPPGLTLENRSAAPPADVARPTEPESRAVPAAATRPAVMPASAPVRTETPVPDATARLSAVALARLAETRQWIDVTDGSRWFIQLVATNTSQIDYAENFLVRADRLLQPEKARLYVANTAREQRIGIIYGDFPDLASANVALARLAPELRSSNPFPRQVLWLK
ncbi:MAG TPA: AAA family ATPase [Rhodocyclaceae bacterium]|nr:AAA family ATPase [Rhodocyclaceae bacterium]